MSDQPKKSLITSLLQTTVKTGGSDLHINAGSPPRIRVDGSLRPVDMPPLTKEQCRDVIYAIMSTKQRAIFEESKELDYSHVVPEYARFRVNVYYQQESVGGTFRVIPDKIKTFDELGLPKKLGELAELPRGLVLVTGPTGSGKSTTLAAIIDLINRTRDDHIVTIEDPVEFVHQHKKCLVSQREIHRDTDSFANALRASLRQDPDVILLGEMRDLETTRTAITAAETGHLVFATLHTQDTTQSMDRIIDQFPGEEKSQIQAMLADCLQAVIAQLLIPGRAGGRHASLEILLGTPAVRSQIREGKTHQLLSTIQLGQKVGMQTMDMSLAELVRNRKVTEEEAIRKVKNESEFKQYLGGSVNMTQIKQ